MKPDLFESAWLLLNRAREHRDEFDQRSDAWQSRNTYSTLIEFDPNSGYYVRKERFSNPLPSFLFPVAANSFNNLRHSLDQAMCASALAKNANVDLHGVYFVFASSEVEFAKRAKSLAAKVAPELMAIMAARKPYKGGNDRLWALSKLTKLNKHRSLIGLGYEIHTIGVQPSLDGGDIEASFTGIERKMN